MTIKRFAAGALTVGALVIPAGVAGAADPVVTCVGAGTGYVDYTASGLLSHRAGQVYFSGYELSCASSDPAYRSGTLSGTSVLTLDCLRGFQAVDSGSWTLRWNGGQTSVIDFTEHSRFAIGHSEGRVVSGPFAGLPYAESDLEGGTLDMCVLNHGRALGAFGGVMTVG